MNGEKLKYFFNTELILVTEITSAEGPNWRKWSNNSFKYPMYKQAIFEETVRCAVFVLSSREGVNDGGRESSGCRTCKEGAAKATCSG